MHLRNQTCVVTGANAGIGKEVTTGLMEHGADVIMACRSLQRCQAAKQELDAQGLGGTCSCVHLDVAHFESVRCFAKGAPSNISVLVNNAGVMGVGPEEDGSDGHLRLNHFGPFLLTRLLLPRMAAHGRIVNVGSEAHYRGTLQIDNGRVQGSGWWYANYARSKLCNTLFTAELQRRLARTGSSIAAYCVSPGRVATGIYQNTPGFLRTIGKPFIQAFFQTPAQGARTVLFAACSPELANKPVLYLHDMKEKQASAAARDPDLAKELWRISEDFVGLSRQEAAGV